MGQNKTLPDSGEGIRLKGVVAFPLISRPKNIKERLASMMGIIISKAKPIAKYLKDVFLSDSIRYSLKSGSFFVINLFPYLKC